jgi:hypothetical protein
MRISSFRLVKSVNNHQIAALTHASKNAHQSERFFMPFSAIFSRSHKLQSYSQNQSGKTKVVKPL